MRIFNTFVALFFLSHSSVGLTQQAPTVPALKVVAPNGQESILLGDLHVGIAGMKQPTAAVFEKARRFVIEHGSGKPKKIEKNEDGQKARWAIGLSKAELQAYSDRASCLGSLQLMGAQSALSNKSAQEANQFAYTVCGQSATSPSRMHIMTSYARAMKLPLASYLEDSDWVEQQRHRVPDTVSEAALHWILNRDPGAVLSATVQAMNVGNYDQILAEHRASLGDAKDADVLVDVMLTERNRHWMPRLRSHLNEGRAVILVGAAHLPGPNGLIELLRADGYKVTTVDMPALAQ